MREAEFERILDRRIQKRLTTDRAYINAENADEQAKVEHRIELHEWARMVHQYGEPE